MGLTLPTVFDEMVTEFVVSLSGTLNDPVSAVAFGAVVGALFVMECRDVPEYDIQGDSGRSG